MADKFTKEKRSRIMAAIRPKNTKQEILVFKELRKRKIYFQRHYSKITGTPDIALPSKKIAVFIDGDFWHGYRFPLWQKRLRSKFWVKKIERNRSRDRKTFAKLRFKGWRVLRVWEHELKTDFLATFEKITSVLK